MARRLADLLRPASPCSSGLLFGFAMTDSKQHLRQPSPKQIAYLRRLADARGVTFSVPRTSKEASREIKRLLALPRISSSDRRRETREIRKAMATGGDAASVRADELVGYGSTATWA